MSRGEMAAFAAVAALAAVAASRSRSPGADGIVDVRRERGSRGFRSLPPGANVYPDSSSVAELVLLEYAPEDFLSVFPDASRRRGRNGVEVWTRDRGAVVVYP